MRRKTQKPDQKTEKQGNKLPKKKKSKHRILIIRKVL